MWEVGSAILLLPKTSLGLLLAFSSTVKASGYYLLVPIGDFRVVLFRGMHDHSSQLVKLVHYFFPKCIDLWLFSLVVSIHTELNVLEAFQLDQKSILGM